MSDMLTNICKSKLDHIAKSKKMRSQSELENLAKEISSTLSIPVIGIASGKYCDGQILVSYDLCGISFNGIPKFVDKKYFKIQSIKERLKKFIQNTQKLPKS